jgi:hypothetical protein
LPVAGVSNSRSGVGLQSPASGGVRGVRDSFSGRAGPSSILARRRGAVSDALTRSCVLRATAAAAALGENSVVPDGESLPSRYSIAHGE